MFYVLSLNQKKVKGREPKKKLTGYLATRQVKDGRIVAGYKIFKGNKLITSCEIECGKDSNLYIAGHVALKKLIDWIIRQGEKILLKSNTGIAQDCNARIRTGKASKKYKETDDKWCTSIECFEKLEHGDDRRFDDLVDELGDLSAGKTDITKAS